MTTPQLPPGRFHNTPRLTVVVAVLVLIGIAATVVLRTQSEMAAATLVQTVALAVPVLLGAAYAERTHRDVRNGVVTEKVRQGAVLALEEEGPRVVTQALQDGAHDAVKEAARAAIREEQVMTRTGPAITAELAALAELVSSGRNAQDMQAETLEVLRQIREQQMQRRKDDQ